MEEKRKLFEFSVLFLILDSPLYIHCNSKLPTFKTYDTEGGGLVFEKLVPDQEVLGWIPTWGTVLCL